LLFRIPAYYLLYFTPIIICLRSLRYCAFILLARWMDQYRFARWRLSSSVLCHRL